MAKTSKTDFSAMIQAARNPLPAPPEEATQTAPQSQPTAAPPPPQDIDLRQPPITVQPAGPRYLSLTPKTVRFRPDQREALTLHARRLARAKQGTERITDDTLIRVAVDGLLALADRLDGDSEAELTTRYRQLLKL